MRRFISRPSPDTLLELTCFDGHRSEDEMSYELKVHVVNADPVEQGVQLDSISPTITLGSLGALVRTLSEYGHSVNDPIVRFAAGQACHI